MENEEIRKAGEYTITQSIKIGDKELVLGEDFSNKEGLFYMVANYEELFGVVGRYDNVMVSDDFLGIIELFSKRLNAEIEQIKADRKGIDVGVITPDMCIPDDYTKSIVGKVIVIKPQALKPEYANELYQIALATHGFGAEANSRGTKVYCKKLFSGEDGLTRRYDVIGELKPEHYPQWLKDKLKDDPSLLKVKKAKEVER